MAMGNEGMSPERTRAYYRLHEAEQQAAKGHLKEAIGIARDALEHDPTYLEVRHWIAQQYEKAGEPRKAAVEYQEIIHASRDDEEAWQHLRRLDPAAADRLDRLHNIAPDPFVMQRAGSDLGDDLDDLTGLADESSDGPAEEPFYPIHDPAAGETDSLAEISGTDAVQPLVGGAEVAVPAAEAEPQGAAAAPAAAGPPAWLYEEDLQYRDRLAQDAFVSGVLPRVVDFWEDTGAWDRSITGLAHLDKRRHEVVYLVFKTAAELFGTEPWELFFSPERRMVPSILRGGPAVVSVTTGMMNTMKPPELQFVAGRLTAHLLAGHVSFLQVVTLVLERTPRSITDVETDIMELLRRKHSGVLGLHRDERKQLGAVCHAWQMRAELSADRGGLICCRDLEAACNAIAKGCCLDSNAAELATWQALREKLKGQDLNQLIAIPTKEDPVRNEGYGFYRIRMLRWWAGTDQGQQLLGLA
jgi:tetratricopeptide (TPR) repeat protein